MFDIDFDWWPDEKPFLSLYLYLIPGGDNVWKLRSEGEKSNYGGVLSQTIYAQLSASWAQLSGFLSGSRVWL